VVAPISRVHWSSFRVVSARSTRCARS
jgi:hypothetical protein